MGASRVQGASLRRKTLHSVLSYKRLHQALFELPVADAPDRPLTSIDARSLAMILRGVAK